MPLVSATDIPYQPFPTGRTSPQAPSDYQQIPTDVAEFGAIQGQALEKLGAQGEKLATSISNVAAYQQHMFDQTALTKMRTDEDDAIYDASFGPTDPATGKKLGKGFLDLYGQDAITQGVPKKALDDARERIAASAPNERVRNLFLQQSRAARQAADNRFAAHYSTQLEHANQDAQHGTILQAGRDATVAGDDDTLEDAINKGRTGAARLPSPEIETAKSDDHIVGSAIAAAIARGEWSRAQTLLDKYGHLLASGDRQEHYAGQLRAHGRRDRIRGDAQEALGEGPTGDGAPTGGGEAPTVRPYKAGEILTGTGASQATYDKFRGRMSKEESGGKYDLAPNQEGYMGKYQMNMKDIRESSARLGIKAPTQQEFLKDPDLQEKLFEAYEHTGHEEMMSNPIYANASPEQKLALLSAWHLTGGPNLNRYLATGQEKSDRLGTKPSDYIKRFSQTFGINPPLYGAKTGPAPAAPGTQVATGPATTVTDATAPADASGQPRPAPTAPVTRTPLPATGPAAEVAADVAAEEAGRGAVPTPVRPAPQAGPKPMIGLEEAIRNANAIADKKSYSDEDREALINRTRAGHSLLVAKVSEERKRLVDEVTNGAALLRSGRPFPYNEAQIRHLMEPPDADKTIQFLQDAEDAGAANIAVSRLSPSEAVDWQNSISENVEKRPQGAARRLQYLAHFNAAIKARDEALNGEHPDPAAYLITRDHNHPPEPGAGTNIAALAQAAADGDPAAIQAYASATLAEQARLGVLPNKRNILTKNTAAGLAQKVATTDPGTADIGIQLSNMQKQYGQYWPQAFGDMVKAGLPREAKILGSMTHPDQAVARQDVQRMVQLAAEKHGMERLKEDVPEADRKAIKDNLDSWVNDFRLSNPGDPDLTHDMRQSVEELAHYYAYRGDSGATAVKKAANGLINAKYDFEGNLRVPKGYRGIVENAGDALKAHIKPEDLPDNILGAPGASPDANRRSLLDSIHNGFWMTNPSDDGAVLYLRTRAGAIIPATLKPQSGQEKSPQVEFKWTEANRLGQFTPAPSYVGGEIPMDAGFVPLGYHVLMPPGR